MKDSKFIYLDLEMDKKNSYRLMHCWEALCECSKWKRHVKDNANAEGDDRSLPPASADRLEMGVKACKATTRAGKKPAAARAGKKVAVLGSIQESLKIFVAELTAEKKKMQEAPDNKWALYLKMQKNKLRAHEKKKERLFMATNTCDMSPN